MNLPIKHNSHSAIAYVETETCLNFELVHEKSISYTSRNVSVMSSDYLVTLTKTNKGLVILGGLVLLVIIGGGAGVFLAEHEHPGANITKLGDAFWWAVVTLATVGYGDYYPVTLVGRIIAIIMMLSGIGIFVLFVSTLAQRKLEREESRLEKGKLLGHDTKAIIRKKIEEIEKLTEEDFDTLVTTMKGLRRTLLANSILTKCPRCNVVYHDRDKFCSNCGLELA